MSELIGSYQTLKDNGRVIAIVNTNMDKYRLVNLDKDIKLVDAEAKYIRSEKCDNIVGFIYIKLI